MVAQRKTGQQVEIVNLTAYQLWSLKVRADNIDLLVKIIGVAIVIAIGLACGVSPSII